MNKQLILWLVVVAIAVILFSWPFEMSNIPYAYKFSDRKPLPTHSGGDEELEQQIKSLCDRLKSAVERRLPDAYEAGEFYPPASDDEIAQLESCVGSPLPADFKIYLQTINGQKWRVALPGIARLLPASMILKGSQEHVGHLERSMKKLPLTLDNYPYWHPRLLLFAQSDGDGNAIDTLTGEIRPFVHDGGTYPVSHPDFLTLLTEIVEDAENNTRNMLDFGPPRMKK